jgi:hypothetical protein
VFRDTTAAQRRRSPCHGSTRTSATEPRGSRQAKGITCQRCGSAYLLCGSTLRSYLGGFSLDLWCQNQVDHPLGHGTRTPFSISSEEGRSIGL